MGVLKSILCPSSSYSSSSSSFSLSRLLFASIAIAVLILSHTEKSAVDATCTMLSSLSIPTGDSESADLALSVQSAGSGAYMVAARFESGVLPTYEVTSATIRLSVAQSGAEFSDATLVVYIAENNQGEPGATVGTFNNAVANGYITSDGYQPQDYVVVADPPITIQGLTKYWLVAYGTTYNGGQLPTLYWWSTIHVPPFYAGYYGIPQDFAAYISPSNPDSWVVENNQESSTSLMYALNVTACRPSGTGSSASPSPSAAPSSSPSPSHRRRLGRETH